MKTLAVCWAMITRGEIWRKSEMGFGSKLHFVEIKMHLRVRVWGGVMGVGGED